MARFDSGDGFVHFVLANAEDRYFLPSLVHVDRSGYLFSLLRGRGYQGVHFLEGLDEDYQWQVFDEDSQQVYQRYARESKSFWGLFSGRQESAPLHTFSPGSASATLTRMVTMIRKERKQAFVVLLDTFGDLASRVPRALFEEFCIAGQKYLAQRGNILVLVTLSMGDHGMGRLLYSSGMDLAGSLCPELRGVLTTSKNTKIFQEIIRVLGRRWIYLNDFSQEQLGLASTYCALAVRLDWDGTRRSLHDLGDFLYAWYHCPSLREETGPVLSLNESHKMTVLLQELCSEAGWGRVCRAIATLRQAHPEGRLLDALKQRYPMEESGVPLCDAHNEIAQKVRLLQVPGTLFQNQMALRRRFDQVCRDYQAVWLHPLSKELQGEIRRCLDALERAGQAGDVATFCWSLESLEYGLAQDLDFGATQQKVWQCRRTAITIYEDIFVLDTMIRQRRADMERLRQGQIALHAYIDQEQRKGVLTEWHLQHQQIYAADRDLANKMKEAKNVSEAIDNLHRNIQALEQRQTVLRKNVEDLKLTLDGLNQRDNQDTIRSLQKAQQWLMEAELQRQKEAVALNDLAKQTNYILQVGGEDPQDVIDTAYDYEKMLRQQERPGGELNLC